MRCVHATTGHSTGTPERPRPITSPWTPFFCVVKVSAMNVTRWRSGIVIVVAKKCWCPIQHCTSCRVNGVVSDVLVPVYSPGRSRKKNARLIMSAIACEPGVADGVHARAATWRIILIGMGTTRLGGGSTRK
jgi:hypothetical protein